LYALYALCSVDTPGDLQLHDVNIDDSDEAAGSRFQSRQNSSAGQAGQIPVASSVTFDVSLAAAAQLAMLEPGSGQRDPRIDEVTIKRLRIRTFV